MKPKIVRVYSENATFQLFETLRRNREKRQQQRAFVLEGVRQINLAVEQGWRITAWIYSHERPLSQWATMLLQGKPAPTHYELTEPLLAKLSSKETPSEVLGLVAMPDDDLARIPLRSPFLTVIFDRPGNPGNLGTIIRSCEALQASGLILTGHAVDLYDPETISASVGALFTLPVVRVPSPKQLEPWFSTLQQHVGAWQLVGSSAKATVDLADHDWRAPTVLVIGNETTGMSAHYQVRCDTVVKIPIAGAVTSLNVACAASILLYEIQRQRALG